ncbi:MAG: hypothetical protein ACREPR_00270, partial [Brasilonema sp.]
QRMNELQSEFCRHKNPVICTLFSYLQTNSAKLIVILWVMSLKFLLVSFFATNGKSGDFIEASEVRSKKVFLSGF